MKSARAEDLARAFDDDFARPVAARGAATEDLLAIRVGAERYVVARRELAGLHADKPVTPLPGDAPGLLGISGFRGALVPVYDLRVVLGVAAAPGAGAPRWLMTAASAPVALAFAQFDAFLRVPREAISAHPDAAGHVRGTVQAGGETRPILDLASILDAIRARAVAAPGPAGSGTP